MLSVDDCGRSREHSLSQPMRPPWTQGRTRASNVPPHQSTIGRRVRLADPRTAVSHRGKRAARAWLSRAWAADMGGESKSRFSTQRAHPRPLHGRCCRCMSGWAPGAGLVPAVMAADGDRAEFEGERALGGREASSAPRPARRPVAAGAGRRAARGPAPGCCHARRGTTPPWSAPRANVRPNSSS